MFRRNFILHKQHCLNESSNDRWHSISQNLKRTRNRCDTNQCLFQVFYVCNNYHCHKNTVQIEQNDAEIRDKDPDMCWWEPENKFGIDKGGEGLATPWDSQIAIFFFFSADHVWSSATIAWLTSCFQRLRSSAARTHCDVVNCVHCLMLSMYCFRGLPRLRLPSTYPSTTVFVIWQPWSLHRCPKYDSLRLRTCPSNSRFISSSCIIKQFYGIERWGG